MPYKGNYEDNRRENDSRSSGKEEIIQTSGQAQKEKSLSNTHTILVSQSGHSVCRYWKTAYLKDRTEQDASK